MHAAAVLVAAGRSTRMAGAGGDRKVFLDLGGRSILERAAVGLGRARGVEELIIVARAEDLERARKIAARVAAERQLGRGEAVPGGRERADSVRAGVLAAGDRMTHVLVHDAARPLVSTATCERALAVAAEHGAALVAIACADTVHRIDAAGRAREVVPRGDLVLAQTPQAFERTRLLEALERAREEGLSPTDEAALWERYFGPVPLVEGERWNLKITTAEDLALARALLAAREEGPR